MKQPRPTLPKADWLRLNELLEQALAMEPGEWPAWLAALPPERATLRELLRELLADTDSTGADGPRDALGSSVARVAADALDSMRHDRPGDRIGPWKLERLLAEGGMGEVWLAQRSDGAVQRNVALKLPRAEWVDRGLTARIARERAILARLQHPHIAVLYDAGVGDDGRPYLALEYVEGVPINTWCERLELREILRLFVQLARAVAHAHAQLVIHRDLKPGNVLVTADGTPKLLDFGISKLLEGDEIAADATELTRQSGQRLTLAYAAPEQVLAQPVGVACDVYALGVMLFELLTGQRLYTNKEGRALEDEILRGAPRRPSDVASDRSRAKALRGDLDAIVLTALRRESNQRYSSAGRLADDIESYLAGEPVKARPDSRLYRWRKFVARHALPLSAAWAAVVALGVGLGVALWQAERATALNTFLLSLIRHADPNASRQTRTADLALLAAIEDKVEQEFKGSAQERLRLRLTVGEAYRNRGEMMAARRAFQRAVDHAAPELSADNLWLLTARVRASDITLIVSTAASEQLDRAIEVLRRKAWRSAEHDELLIDALLTRHTLQIEFGLPANLPSERRLEVGREALALAISRFGEGSRQHLRAVAVIENATNNIEGIAATRQLLESAVQQAKLRGPTVTDSAEFLVADARRAARQCEDRAQPAEAIALLRDTITRVRAAHGATSLQLERLHLALGRCEHVARDPRAFSSIEAAYEIAAAREQPPSTNLMRRAQSAFDAAMQARQLIPATRFIRSALDNAEAIPEPELRERLTLFVRIGQLCLHAQSGDYAAAERTAGPLIAYSNAVYAKVRRLTPRQGALWTCLSQAQRQQGHFDQALKTLGVFIERCATTPLAPALRPGCEGEALIERTLIELDTGRVADAQATLAARMAMSPVKAEHPTYALAHGRVLLAGGEAAQAIEPLQRHHATWAVLQPDSPYTAEALYWLGRAHRRRTGAHGRAMMAQAREALANSPVRSHRLLGSE
jgi:tRNA A-37 threonylcarbamoyl transferase component Bud32/tetratricopeptide (TPR) repeat protein